MTFQLLSIILLLCFTVTIQDRKVNTPPSITTQPKPFPRTDWNPELGDRVRIYLTTEQKRYRIPCIAVAEPSVKKSGYKWYKDGKELDLDSDDLKSRVTRAEGIGTLVIEELQSQDFGTYQCTATNDGDSVSYSKKIELIQAQSNPFASTTPFETKATLGASLTLKCNPPSSTPNATIIWSDDGDVAMMPLSDRVVVDYDGNLHFVNIKREDSNDGEKKYTCYSKIPSFKWFGGGPDQIITIPASSGKGIKQPQQMDWNGMLPENGIGLEEEMVKFMCIFKGNPTPEISWTKQGSDKTLAKGHELIINKTKPSHEGTYLCTGTNKLVKEKTTHSFQLTVQSKPSWKSPPKNIRVSVNETVSISCQANGKPKPTVDWFINGEQFTDFQRKHGKDKVSLNDDIATFKSLMKGDSVVIQCNATNAHGSLFTDFYLNVLALPPEITLGPGDQKVAKESDAVLKCEHNGYPTPKLTWKKGVQYLKGARYITTQDSITIKAVEKNDEGQITCFSKNLFGEVNSTGTLLVREKTFIKSAFPDIEIDEDKRNTDIRCYAYHDPNEKPRYVWLKDGKRLEKDSAHYRFLEGNAKLRIVEGSKRFSGTYTCRVETDVDSDEKSMQFKVKAAPEPPSNVRVLSCADWKVGLIWEAGHDNFVNITHYSIQYKTGFHPDQWTDLMQTKNTATTVSGIKLSAGVVYTFRIIAHNALGQSEPSEPNNAECETDSKKPARHPGRGWTKEDQPGSLIVEWQHLDEMELNGKNFEYVIEILKEGETTAKTYIVDQSSGSYRRDGEAPYQKYTITVKSRNEKGFARGKAESFVGYSGMDKPSIIPQNFSQDVDKPFTYKEASFVWDAVDSNAKGLNGKFNGYRILYWKNSNPNDVNKVDIPPSKVDNQARRRRSVARESHTIANLPAYANLTLTIKVGNVLMYSDPSDPVYITTPEGVPGQVRDLKAENVRDTQMTVHWEVPRHENGIILKYKIYYRSLNGLKMAKTSEIISHTDLKDLTHTLGGLEPKTPYRVFVVAVTQVGDGEAYYIDVITAPSGPPPSPMITNIRPYIDGFNVSWTSVKREVTVSYRRDGEADSKYKEVNGTVHGPTESSVLISGLAGGWYVIKVEACNGIKCSSDVKNEKVIGPAALNPEDEIFKATWFIIIMVAIAILILIIIIVCLVKRNRGDKYNEKQRKARLQERENAIGIKNDEKKPLPNGDFDDNSEKQPLAGSPYDEMGKGPLESDKDSLEEYGDVDPSKFNEDGSFIGQYGNQNTTPSEVIAPSAMHSLV